MTTLNARANQAWHAEDRGDFTVAELAAFEEGWETGYKTAQAEVANQISDAIQMYDQEWSANTWRSIAARIARQVGGLS